MRMVENSMMGLFIGDALGAQVEFKTKSFIREYFLSKGGFDLYEGGTFNLIRGQVTDDSQMSIALIRSFKEMNEYYDSSIAKKWYKRWLSTNPFDYGITTSNALRYDSYNYDSQANGALMRCAPLGWKYRNRALNYLMKVAEEDCKITHPNKVCISANKVYLALIHCMLNNYTPKNAYESVCNDDFFTSYDICEEVREIMKKAKRENVTDFLSKQGWVLIALQNALFHLYHLTPFKEAMKETIYSGGDTDTNACICGALIGVYRKDIDSSWKKCVCMCEPDNTTKHPSPEWLWTSKYKELLSIINS